MNYTALNTELTTDPTNIGYAADIAAGSDSGVAALINAVGSTNVNLGTVSRAQFAFDFAAILTQIGSLTVGSQVARQFDTVLTVLLAADQVNVSSQTVTTLAASAIAAGICTQDQWNACALRPGSRAEVLWGAGTVVSSDDVSIALRGNT